VAGNFSLPQVKAKVTDQLLYEDDRYTQRIVSNNLSVEVSDAPKSVLTKINITASTLRYAKTGNTPNETPNPLVKGVPVGDIDSSRSIGGFQSYMLFGVIIILVVILKM
jgi:hypothetical protein